MTCSERLAAILVGAILMVSARGVCGQHSSKPSEYRGTRAAPAASAPRTPAEMPPKPPKVTCSGDMLTISAQNSTLAAVMNAVGDCSGAEIVLPEGAAGLRMYAELGPGRIRAVVAELLNSTDFNYVIAGSPSDPQSVLTVLLSPQPSDATTEVASLGNVPSNWSKWIEAQPNHERSAPPSQDEPIREVDAALVAPVGPAVAPARSIPVTTLAMHSESAASSAVGHILSEVAQYSARAGAAQIQARNTEQMIADMRRLYEQRRQMVQQQTPAGE